MILFAFGLGVTAIRHGEPRNDKYSFWWQLAGNLVIVWLLWCGGFFSQACAAQPPQAALQYRDDVIRNARLEWGLSAPVADFAAQLHQESGWRPDAVSPAGAQGLAQFMPATADWISQLMPGLNSREPFNPAWAIRALVSYDRWLWQRVSAASDCERMAMTLSGYNGGLGWVQRDRRLASQKGLDSTRWFGHVATVNAGRNAASWRENRHYPQRILRELAPRYLTWGGSSCVASGEKAAVARHSAGHSYQCLSGRPVCHGIQKWS
ncbi:transglycosylase SLT domain-containing protein [Escherichia coli]|nr:transglycosylase SLT domain-containing protein [Escherichia coli]